MALAIKYFDIHEFVKRSTELGASEALTEYQIIQFEQALEIAVKSVKDEVGAQNIVSKIDLENTRLELQKAIENTRLELQKDIESLRLEFQRDLASTKLELQKDIENLRLEFQRDLTSTKLELQKDIESLRLEFQRDLASTKLELQKDIEITKLELQKDIAQIEARLIKWSLGIGVSSTLILCGAMFTMLKLMLH